MFTDDNYQYFVDSAREHRRKLQHTVYFVSLPNAQPLRAASPSSRVPQSVDSQAWVALVDTSLGGRGYAITTPPAGRHKSVPSSCCDCSHPGAMTNACLAVYKCPPAATGFWGSQLFPLGATGKRDRLAERSLLSFLLEGLEVGRALCLTVFPFIMASMGLSYQWAVLHCTVNRLTHESC